MDDMNVQDLFFMFLTIGIIGTIFIWASHSEGGEDDDRNS